jgi:hypothetical protein
MGQVVFKAGVKKEPGFLYFVDKNGNISRVEMARGKSKSRKKKEVVFKAGITKESGFLYYVDKNGNISRAKMARGRK